MSGRLEGRREALWEKLFHCDAEHACQREEFNVCDASDLCLYLRERSSREAVAARELAEPHKLLLSVARSVSEAANLSAYRVALRALLHFGACSYQSRQGAWLRYRAKRPMSKIPIFPALLLSLLIFTCTLRAVEPARVRTLKDWVEFVKKDARLDALIEVLGKPDMKFGTDNLVFSGALDDGTKNPESLWVWVGSAGGKKVIYALGKDSGGFSAPIQMPWASQVSRNPPAD